MNEDIEDMRTKLNQCHDVDTLVLKALREIYVMYPNTSSQVILIALSNLFVRLVIAAGISKEDHLKYMDRTYDIVLHED